MGQRGTWPPQDQPQYDPGQHAQRLGAQGYPPQQQQPYGQQYPQPPYQDQQPWQPQPRPGGRRRRHTVRNVLAALGGLVVVIIGISVAASGGAGHTLSTSGSTTASTPGRHAAAKTSAAGIGSAITLTGNSSGEQMAVTVTKVVTDARPGDEFSAAPAGDRLYAVQFRLRDTGSAAYSDAPSNGAQVVDSAGQSYQASLDTAAGCTSFPATVNIGAGATGLGCIVFEVPRAAKITAVQFTLDSGMGPSTGQWDVTR